MSIFKYRPQKEGNMEKFSFLLDFNSLKENLHYAHDKPNKTLSGTQILDRFSNYVNGLDNKSIREIIKLLFHKWSHNPRTTILKRSIKRSIQNRYYKEIYGFEIPAHVQKTDDKCFEELILKDEPYTPPQPPQLKEFKPPKPQKQAKKKEKPPKPTTKFSKKMQELDLPDVIKWAKEIGVPEDKIAKHKEKPLGLAKMNIGNLIRNKLRKDNKLGDLLEIS